MSIFTAFVNVSHTLGALIWLCLTFYSATTAAEWSAGVSASRLQNDSLEMDAVGIALGYQIGVMDGVTFAPRLRWATGVSESSISNGFEIGTAELEQFFALSIRGRYELHPRIYGFLEPSYGYTKISARYAAVSDSSEAWELGMGAGLGLKLTDRLSLEVQSEKYDDTRVVSAGLHFFY